MYEKDLFVDHTDRVQLSRNLWSSPQFIDFFPIPYVGPIGNIATVLLPVSRGGSRIL